VLRELLQKITDDGDPASHPKVIAELAIEQPHTIKCLTGPADKIEKFTCVMHALGIEFNSEYIDLVERLPSVIYASTNFVHFLLQKRELIERSIAPNLLIIYFDGDPVKHIGRMATAERVRSKWGIGHLYEHAIWEVPQRYGDNVRFYSPMAPAFSIAQFIEYARASGFGHFVNSRSETR
jgi:hypothetical protein